jgi:hypothetical protein
MAPRRRVQYQIKAEPPPSVVALLNIPKWFAWEYPWSEPVRLKLGIRPYLQHFYEAPSRYLPTPNVTGQMSVADAPNNDKIKGFINVYIPAPLPTISVSGAGASIVEEP